ncbi:Protein YidD [hydrothermal vent metagenome]|uniref:Protein YidD n=1 Tax=hydrothermal vent metagenome TaxID=652676 RepID=A0A1W1ELC0_9ZZZZ
MNFFTHIIKGYQYISKMLPASCRYHPTCSDYAIWQFDTNRVDLAILNTTTRIVRCNQFFAGGIDYPIIKYKKPLLLQLSRSKIVVKYWIIPKEKDRYIVIKDYNAN